MANSSQIVINLQDSRQRVDEIKSSLDQASLITDSENMEGVFKGVKSSLLKVVNSIDQIIRFDADQVHKNPAQAKNVQSFADLVQRNLFEGRMLIYNLRQEDLDSITEKAAIEIINLMQAFSSLQEVYETNISEDHQSFNRLSVPEVSGLFGFNGFGGLEYAHRVAVSQTLRDFIDINSKRSAFENYGETYKANIEFLFPLFKSLSDGLVDEVEMISNDLSELELQGNYTAQQYPYIERFRAAIEDINGKPFSVTQLKSALTKEDAYFRLCQKLIDIGLENVDLKQSDLVKVALTLQALRIKSIEAQNETINLQMLINEKMLAFNDTRSSKDKNLFLKTANNAMQHLRELEAMQISNNGFTASNVYPPPQVSPFQNDIDSQITIETVKKELAEPEALFKVFRNPESALSKLLQENRLLLRQANITKKDLLLAVRSFDNKALKELLNRLIHKTTTNATVHYRQAAQLVHILSRSFAHDLRDKSSINNPAYIIKSAGFQGDLGLDDDLLEKFARFIQENRKPLD